MSDDDKLERLGKAVNRLIEEGRLKPGERKVCITLDIEALEDADRIADEAIAKAQEESRSKGE